ncbi:MAG: hypothetical protein D3903_01110 [Candidatus Electrothrix sp. GM3_4]|nr:hypothetical protein [Candidatus Electrothrix sp. GM3_4]
MLKKKLRTFLERLARKRAFRKKIARCDGDLKVILGAGPTKQDGWIETNFPDIDITDKKSFAKFFPRRNVNIFLAEHVWEHLTIEESFIALKNCYDYLMPGGLLRVAVPDGFHDDQEYINYVKPGGTGIGSDDHQVLYNYQTLSDLFKKAGFEITVLEFFDENGIFNYQEWTIDNGFVVRSTRFDPRNTINKTAYTSLIVDGVKPGKPKRNLKISKVSTGK